MKTFLLTMVIKVGLGYTFIQEIKRMNDTLGSVSPNEPGKELLMAAVFPNPVFLVIGVISFILAWEFRAFFNQMNRKIN